MKKLLLLLIALLVSQSLQANILYYGSERETIRLTNGVSTILRFDEEVKTISQAADFLIGPANPDDPDYRVLSVSPRVDKATSEVTFILANDVVINTKLITVAAGLPDKVSTFYDLKPKSLKIDPVTKMGEGSNITEIELMKAMIRSDKVIGYTAQAMSQEVRTGIEGVSARLMQVYTGPNFHGYVFKVTNNSKDKNYALDVKSLTMGRPNVAILTQADDSILEHAPGKPTSTLLRIVAKPSAVYYSVTLPVAPIVEKPL